MTDPGVAAPPTGVRLARGRVDDAEALADCHRACWREAYGPLVRGDLLEQRLADRGHWVGRARDRQTRSPDLLAFNDGSIVGFASVGPTRDPRGPAPQELRALYVRAAWHGTGLGQTLLDAALDRTQGCWLWVLEANARARAFYSRNGFVAEGGRKTFEPLDAWEVRLLRPAS